MTKQEILAYIKSANIQRPTPITAAFTTAAQRSK